jgi:hypothetical protein
MCDAWSSIGIGGSRGFDGRARKGRTEEREGLVGPWLVMHKHQYRLGYSGAKDRDRRGMVRCGVVPQAVVQEAARSTVRHSSTPGHTQGSSGSLTYRMGCLSSYHGRREASVGCSRRVWADLAPKKHEVRVCVWRLDPAAFVFM